MDVLELASGLWRWTTFHEEWREDVGSVYCETADGVVLIDPLVPMRRRKQRASGARSTATSHAWTVTCTSS